MKTTEIFVEQVIIGGLVMLTGYILFPIEIQVWLQQFHSTLAQVSIGALLTGAAYLIGTVYDRFTDTMFQDLEKHCRLSYALTGIKSEAELETDPYPESVYRMAVLTQDSAAQKEDYFRRRLRLTRAFATLIPGISVAVILNVSTCCSGEPWYELKATMIPLAYLLAFLYKTIDCTFLKDRRPPKTNNQKKLKDYWIKHDSERKRRLWKFMLSDGTCIILLITLVSLGIFQIFQSENDRYIITVMLTGIILAAVVTWSWWRIYHTYFAFVKNFYESIKGDEIKMKSSITLSAEVRWFFGGDIPEVVEEWFNAGKLKEKSKERTDTYLIYPHAKSCGVKFRRSKFEIKTLVQDLGLRKFGANVEGVAEIWEKWSTKDDSIKTFKQKVAEGEADWIAVKKKRVTRKYSADEGSINEVDASAKHSRPHNGCNAELTKIEIDEKPYWTLAIDSFGERDGLEANLAQTLNILLSEVGCPFASPGVSLAGSLSKETSHSYPSFLAQYKPRK